MTTTKRFVFLAILALGLITPSPTTACIGHQDPERYMGECYTGCYGVCGGSIEQWGGEIRRDGDGCIIGADCSCYCMQ